MAEPDDMIIPLLREMRAEFAERFSKVDTRLEALDQKLAKFGVALETFRQALGAERKVRELEAHK